MMSQKITNSIPGFPESIVPGSSMRFRLLALPLYLQRTLRLWHDRSAGRRALARMDLEQLMDIGVTSEEARVEAGKRFWR